MQQQQQQQQQPGVRGPGPQANQPGMLAPPGGPQQGLPGNLGGQSMGGQMPGQNFGLPDDFSFDLTWTCGAGKEGVLEVVGVWSLFP